MKRHRLRASLFAAAALVLTVAGGLFLMVATGYGRLGDESFRAARTAISEASLARGDEYASAPMDSARVWLARAEAMNVDIPRTWYGRPRADLVHAALSQVPRWTAAALAQAESARAVRMTAARARLASAEADLATMKVRAGRASGKRTNRTLATRAELEVAEARRWLERGEPARAETALSRLESRSSRLGERLDEDSRRFDSADSQARWRTWVAEGTRLSRSGTKVLVVEKESRSAFLIRGGKVSRVYSVDLGVEGTRPKTRQGDLATPEGLYTITRKKSGGETRYHKALLLNYPNAEDRARFQRRKRDGEIAPGTKLGGSIEIHGDGGRRTDWTLGCVALANPDMDALYGALSVGDRVVIVGRVPEGLLDSAALREARR